MDKKFFKSLNTFFGFPLSVFVFPKEPVQDQRPLFRVPIRGEFASIYFLKGPHDSKFEVGAQNSYPLVG